MRILIVTPAAAGSRSGNRVTAMRWARLLRQLGHTVRVATAFERQRPDLLIALHARRAHQAIVEWRRRRPDAPLVLALTGTDLYGDIQSDADAQQSLELADRLVVLQQEGLREIPPQMQARARVIVQSVTAPKGSFTPRRKIFEICVLGHLRKVKDPFRCALAARELDASSRIRVIHAGRALSVDMEQQARREEEENPRYRWAGELPRWRAMRLLARSRALVLTSITEGGANVVCEAIACGVPVIASRIAGSIGLLGQDYPGYFDVGDTSALATRLRRLEIDPTFVDDLKRHISVRAPQVQPDTEREKWRELLEEFQL